MPPDRPEHDLALEVTPLEVRHDPLPRTEPIPTHGDEVCNRAWVYDLRTNNRFTLKERPLRQSDLAEFVTLARLRDRHTRQEHEQQDRWRRFPVADLVSRDRADLNLQWLQDDKATNPAALPPPCRRPQRLQQKSPMSWRLPWRGFARSLRVLGGGSAGSGQAAMEREIAGSECSLPIT